MNPLLLLHKRHTPDDSAIWRVAIRCGWNTERTDAFHVKEHIEGRELVRYYGNVLHASQIAEYLPFRFIPIEPGILPSLTKFTKRKMEMVSFGNLGQPVKQTAFYKPVNEKWFTAKVYNEGESIVPDHLLIDDLIYVSEIVKFVDEVRCFVLDGEIMTSSLYRINGQVWDLTGLSPGDINFDNRIKDTPIPGYIKEICQNNILPKGVVIDFGRLENGDWVLIEFNEAYASGLYYCDPYLCFPVICASQENQIS